MTLNLSTVLLLPEDPPLTNSERKWFQTQNSVPSQTFQKVYHKDWEMYPSSTPFSASALPLSYIPSPTPFWSRLSDWLNEVYKMDIRNRGNILELQSKTVLGWQLCSVFGKQSILIWKNLKNGWILCKRRSSWKILVMRWWKRISCPVAQEERQLETLGKIHSCVRQTKSKYETV